MAGNGQGTDWDGVASDIADSLESAGPGATAEARRLLIEQGCPPDEALRQFPDDREG